MLHTTLITSPGSYYHAHIKPSSTNSHTALTGSHADSIPGTATHIVAANSWLLATEYYGTPRILTIWIKASKTQRPLGYYYGMRFAHVDSHHLGALHSPALAHKQVAREPTGDEVSKTIMSSPQSIHDSKQDQHEFAKRVRAMRQDRARRGLVEG